MGLLILIILIPVLQVLVVWLLVMREKRQMDLARRAHEARVAHLPVRPKFIVD